MQEKDMEFSLEDILREFGSGDPEQPQASAEPAQDPKPADEPASVEEKPQPEPAAEPASKEPEQAAEPEKQEPAPAQPEPKAQPQEEEEDFTSDFWQAIKSSPLTPEDEAARAEALNKAKAEKPVQPEETGDVRIFPEKQNREKKTAQALGATRRFNVQPTADPAKGQAGDTIRLDTDAVSAGAKKPGVSAETQVFDPVNPEGQKPQGAEPFSQGWGPRYEEPMGEYVPPEPIVFRPRSRLGELKKKLVAGPERRYYALAEQGMGKLQVSIFLSCLVLILSAAAIALHQMDMVQENRMRLLVFGELFAMLLAALLGSGRLIDGIAAIFKGKFTLDTLLFLTFGVCVADCMFCLDEIRVPFCAVFCLEITMSQWAELQRRNTEMGQMDTMRKAVRLNRVAKAPDCYNGRPGFFVDDGEVEDFMDTYNATSGPEKAMNVYALLAFLLSGGIGLMTGLMKNSVSDGLRVWSMAILAAVPATAFLCHSRPMAILERRMHKLGVVICGWQGVKAAGGKSVIPIGDNDLLPGGSVKVNGVKFYSRRNTDQTVAYATALIEASGMGIANLFTQLLDSRYGHHYEVENFRFYENGGIGGDVCGEPVLVGSLSFLQEMGVELPEGARVSQAVYVAVDGELCGVFAMAYGKLKGVSAAMGTLCGYRRLTPVLVTENFLLTESFIRAKYGANTRRMGFPNLEERQALRAWQPKEENKKICALTTQDGLAPTGFAITGARALGSAMRAGTWVHILCGVLGMAIVLALSLVKGGEVLLTPGNLMLLELIWAVPGFLITEWPRHL